MWISAFGVEGSGGCGCGVFDLIISDIQNFKIGA